jgi:hypothetical protein
MAYTRVWDNSAPPGSALANTIDTIFQEFRQDTQQRISSLLRAGTDIDTDPLQLKPSVIGLIQSAVKRVNPFLNISPGVGSEVSGLSGANGMARLRGVGGGLVTGSFDVAVQLEIPINAQLTLVNVYGNRVSVAGTTNVRIYTFDVVTGTYTLVATLGALPAGYAQLSSGVIGPIVTTGTNIILMRINATATPNQTIECAIGGLDLVYDILAGNWVP